MPRKGKGPKSRKKRDYIPLNFANLNDDDLRIQLTEMKRRQFVKKAKKARGAAVEAEHEALARVADNAAEVELSPVPLHTTAYELVLQVGTLLAPYANCEPSDWLHAMETGSYIHNGPVLRCSIRRTRGRCFAFLVLRGEGLAEQLIAMSPLNMGITLTAVRRNNRPFIVSDSRLWRTQPDVHSITYDLRAVTMGEQITDTDFSVAWSIPQQPSYTATMQLNRIQRMVIIESNNPILMRTASPDGRSFQFKRSKIRIEIPFRTVWDCDFQAGETRSTRGVYFRVGQAPLLLRQSDRVGRLLHDPLFWDCLSQGTPQQWTRTVDPTQTEDFSLPAVRVVIDQDDVKGLRKALYHAGLLPDMSPEYGRCIVSNRPTGVRAQHVLNTAKRSFSIPFSVRYLVFCIVTMGNLSLQALTDDFWRALSNCVTEEQALAALDIMYFVMSNPSTLMTDGQRSFVDYLLEEHEEESSGIHRPVSLLYKCLGICNVITDHSRGGASSVKEYSSDELGEQDADELLQNLDALSVSGASDTNTASEMAFMITGDERYSKRALTDGRKHEAIVRRVTVTPTRIVSQKPELDMLNRVLRHYYDHKDRFIRVNFCDEDGGNIAFPSSEDLYARLRVIFREGLQVAGETFVFLAFSNSQLREHSLWMYNETRAPGDGHVPSADDIRSWMGDFSDIRVPGKFAARQGQAFSSTVRSVAFKESQIYSVGDVSCGNGKYVFSDGVGMISSDVASRVAKSLQFRPRGQVPSAFQIRLGGAKGMLTVINSKVLKRTFGSEIEVVLRESMTKFYSEHKALEIASVSKRFPAFLNRQIILLLSDQGVPDDIFLHLQRSVIDDMDRCMEMDGISAAHKVLHSSNNVDQGHKLHAAQPSIRAMELFNNGLNCVNCEYLFNMMSAFRARLLNDMKARARIPLDPNTAVCLLGIMDEFGVLEEREVFCQFKHPDTGEKTVFTGLVVVGRSPCLHPADIQLLTAVDRPELRDFVDVIVFPGKGERPIPSMLSGGDLDGDIYFCFNDDRLLPPDIGRVEPMNYEAPKPVELTRPVQWTDVADFVVNYIKNDNLGKIANAHLVAADKERGGVHAEKCLKLANYHSTAVDFPKTGVPAAVPPNLLPGFSGASYPDFMGKHKKISYPSQKVLGKLYRACDARVRSKVNGKTTFKKNKHSEEVRDIFFQFAIDADTKEAALASYHAYSFELYRIMEHFGVQTEGELISGQVLSFQTDQIGTPKRHDFMASQVRVNRQMQALRADFRARFFEELGMREEDQHDVMVLTKAVAWYQACEEEAEAAREEDCTPLLSFPWVMSDILLQILRVELKARRKASLEDEPVNVVLFVEEQTGRYDQEEGRTRPSTRRRRDR